MEEQRWLIKFGDSFRSEDLDRNKIALELPPPAERLYFGEASEPWALEVGENDG